MIGIMKNIYIGGIFMHIYLVRRIQEGDVLYFVYNIFELYEESEWSEKI